MYGRSRGICIREKWLLQQPTMWIRGRSTSSPKKTSPRPEGEEAFIEEGSQHLKQFHPDMPEVEKKARQKIRKGVKVVRWGHRDGWTPGKFIRSSIWKREAERASWGRGASNRTGRKFNHETA